MRDGPMKIGEFARSAGVTTKTVRFYEKQGLIRPSGRTEGGFRLYSGSELEVVRYIKWMKLLGFTLGEIKELGHAGGELQECEPLRARLVKLLDEKLAELDARIESLRQLRDQIDLYRSVQRARKDAPAQPCGYRSGSPPKTP